MDIYDAQIRQRRLHISMKGTHPFKYEFEVLHSALGESSNLLTTYARIDSIDFLVIYNEQTFEKNWEHVIHPKPAGPDWTNEEIERITGMRRLIFPFSERTAIDWNKGGHVHFDPYSLVNFNRMPTTKESARLAGKLKLEVAVSRRDDRLIVFKREDVEKYSALDRDK